MPKPVAADDFLLSLDLSPSDDLTPSTGQRISLCANGEVLFQGRVTRRQTIECRLSRRSISAAEELTITLLHPEARCCASPVRPLDTRVLSINIHALSLTAARIGVGEEPPTLATDVAANRRPVSRLVRGNPVRLATSVVPRQVLTHHGTVIFADTVMGELRHGPLRESPGNVLFVRDGWIGYLLYRAHDDILHTIMLYPDINSPNTAAALDPNNVTDWQFKVIGTDGPTFGLQRSGLFLCAEDTGKMTLSRQHLSLWERFGLCESQVEANREP